VALGIKIVNTSATKTKYLQVEAISAALSRGPSLIKLPGDTNLTLDFGMSDWEFSLTGVADDAYAPSTGGLQVANFYDLCEMRTWSTDGLCKLYIHSTTTYLDVRIRSINMSRESGTEYWSFQMALAVEIFTFPP